MWKTAVAALIVMGGCYGARGETVSFLLARRLPQRAAVAKVFAMSLGGSGKGFWQWRRSAAGGSDMDAATAIGAVWLPPAAPRPPRPSPAHPIHLRPC